MAKTIFIWTAHPGAESFCAALADAYAEGAEAAGAEVRRLQLSEMNFEVNFGGYRETAPELAPDLVAWRDAIVWADHIAIVHPYWWGAMPARAKAVLDQALTPGFGFKYHDQGVGWDKLLTGRTGDVIITSDTPPWYDTLVFKKPGRRVIANQVLGFCGIKPRKIVQFGTIKTATASKREGWLARARKLGESAAR